MKSQLCTTANQRANGLNTDIKCSKLMFRNLI